jgi:predicted ATPase/class 3 adenylate cyclase
VVTCGACGEQSSKDAKFCSSCGAPIPAGALAAPEVRKTVTVVFSDVIGSTSIGERLDPEALRALMTRYYDEMKHVLERHGGVVRELIGDAVMAVFGAPVAHEDDALRAVRAAAEMSERLASLNDELERDWDVRLSARTGVNTGGVVAEGPGADQPLVLGDAINVAARFEQAAEPGEILLGEATYRLVRDSVEVEAVAPLALKGKSELVPAWRLLSLLQAPAETERRLDAPLIGRRRELGLLHDAFERTVRDRTCELVTVLGPAGVGKSRLTREFLAAAGENATVCRGRCLPYGDGITFWPIAEVVRAIADIGEGDAPHVGREKVAALLRGNEDADLIAERVAAAIGLTDRGAELQEIFWAIRKLCESLAREQPLICVFDDIHWAEAAFLDLVEHLAGWTADVPLLLLCIARPELLDSRPSWAAGGTRMSSVQLVSLSENESEHLITSLLGHGTVPQEVLRRVGGAAEGNPLFVQELLRMLVDDGLLESRNGDWRVTRDLASLPLPPSIEALLAARLDRLDPGERGVIQRASVVGKVFWWGAVAALSPETVRSDVGRYLRTLVRKELISPDPTSFAGEDGFRFGHILVRDAAYQSIPKAGRAELHERFAHWLEERTGERSGEYEEIVGFHLEQAVQARMGLGPVEEPSRRLAARAAERLRAAGLRASARGDMPAAANLLSRASALLAQDDPVRLNLLPDLGNALFNCGELADAESVLDEALEQARLAGDRRVEAHALINRASLREAVGESTIEEAALAMEQGVTLFQQVGDDGGLARAFGNLGESLFHRGRLSEAAETFERARRHARRANDERLEASQLAARTTALVHGLTPLQEAVAETERSLEWARTRRDRRLEAKAAHNLAVGYAMRGRFDRARSLAAEGDAVLKDLGLAVAAAAGPAEVWGILETLAGAPASAERALRLGYDALESMGVQANLATLAAMLAHALAAQGRDEDAERFAARSEAAAATDDVNSQVLWRSARAKLLAARGESAPAERLARNATELAAQTDFVILQADALLDLGEVLRLADRPADAAAAVQSSLQLHERKGNLVSAKRARELLDRLSEKAAG